jgi:hypothetical protein
VEAGLYAPLDLLTVRIRDSVIPRAIKRRVPFLSCRRYGLSGTRPRCGPLMKYRCRAIFGFVCRHCDTGNGQCGRVM